MKKSRKKKNLPISAGTLAMLLLTIAVLAGCAAFLMLIGGETLRSQADEAERMVQEAGVTLISEEERARSIEQEIAQARARATAAATQPAQRETPAPRRADAHTFTLAAAGTVHAPKAIRSAAQGNAGEYDFSEVFSGLGDMLSGADLTIATLETLTAGEKKGYGNYNAPAQLIDALRGCGVDLLSLSTEHALDKGYDGLQITLSELNGRGMEYAGVRIAEETGACRISIDGIEIAVLAYTYGLSDEGKETASREECEAVCVMDARRMTQDIKNVRADGAQVVIVMPHWGTKNKLETPEEVRALARTLAEAGADVIIGTHPNVVQGTERLQVVRPDGLEYEAVVCYSLGCLLTDARMEENAAGMVARLQITYDPQARRVSLGSLACMPVYIARQKEDGRNVFRVVDVENAQALEALTQAAQQEAQHAAQRVREITGQSEMEEGGQG